MFVVFHRRAFPDCCIKQAEKISDKLPMTADNPVMPAKESTAAFLALIGSGFVWGVSWLPLKYFGGFGLTGHAIVLTAYLMVAIVALPLVWRERHQWRPEFRLLLLIGLFFGFANMALTSALTSGSVVRAMMLFFLLPAWGAIGGAIFLKERITARRVTAVLMSLFGVVVIMGGIDIFLEPWSAVDLTALSAGLFYTAAGIVNRKARVIPMLSRTLVSFIGCSLVAICGLAFSVPVIPELPLQIWGLLTLFAFIWLLGGTMLTTFGVTYIQASRAAVLQVVELLVAVLSAIWLGGEVLSLTDCLGAVLIVTATLIEAFSQPQT